MSILYLLVPLALLLGLSGLVAFIQAVRTGQFKDLDTPSLRALLDTEEKK